MLWALSVLEFGSTRNGYVFFPDHLWRKKKALTEHVGLLTIKGNQFLDELTKMSGLLTVMANEIISLGYPHLFDEMVQSLSLEIKKKDVTLTFFRRYYS